MNDIAYTNDFGNKFTIAQLAAEIIKSVRQQSWATGPGPRPESDSSEDLAHFYGEGNADEDGLVHGADYHTFVNELIAALEAARA